MSHVTTRMHILYMRIVNSLISLRQPCLDAFSHDNDLEAGTSIEARIKPELVEVFEPAACIPGLRPPTPPTNEPRNDENGFPPPGPPKGMALG
jgi:hypothetical protein